MTILTKDQVAARSIIHGADDPKDDHAKGWNRTSFDSRVGLIITSQGILKDQHHDLPPRGIAWVISMEDYKVPTNITGITTLKTGWTKKGVLTLTAGIVDPGYHGPISTAVINFSKTKFPIQVGDEFFRTVFFEHDDTKCEITEVPRDAYISEVLADRLLSSETFLTFEDFGDELQRKVFRLPRLAFWFAIGGLILALLGLTVPPVIGLANEVVAKNEKLNGLRDRLMFVEEQLFVPRSRRAEASPIPEQLENRISELEVELRQMRDKLENDPTK